MNNADMPASPVTIKASLNTIRQADASGCSPPEDSIYKGLTKREHFAGLAMQGILTNSLLVNEISDIVSGKSILKPVATLALNHADTLLKELEK